MNCKGNFVFKTLTLRQGGTFKNANGDEINYPSAYILKVDEILENGDVNERKFKIANDKTVLINTLKGFKTYQGIILTFKITLFDTKTALEIIDVEEEEADIDFN